MLSDAAYCLAESVVNSENGMEYLENSKYETYFVVNEFTGTIFDNLRKKMRPKRFVSKINLILKHVQYLVLVIYMYYKSNNTIIQ